MIADLESQRALDRYHQVGISGLTDEEKTLATIWYFESKVANNGFTGWFKSKEGELAPYAPTAFRNVGAPTLAKIAERANAVFGPSGISPKKAEREYQVASLSPVDLKVLEQLEIEYAEYPTDLDDRLETYAGKTRGSGQSR